MAAGDPNAAYPLKDPPSLVHFLPKVGNFYWHVKAPIPSETQPLFEACRTVSMHQCGFFGKFYVDEFFCS